MGTIRPQSFIAQTMFTGLASFNAHPLWTEWGVTNYRPLSAVAALYDNPPQGEARLSTGDDHAWRYRCWRGSKFAISSHLGVGPNDSDFVLSSGGTHDIVGCYVKSSKNALNMAAAHGYFPGEPPAKKRDMTERYFGYQNLGFVHHGGVTQAVWAGGTFANIPARLFYTPEFTVEFQSGYAFLTDGITYVAWRPTIGSPQVETGLPDWDPADGLWLRSSHTPGPEGEAGIVEAGDAAMFGSYAAFKADVLARNPAPTWSGKVTYKAKDGAVVEFGADYAMVNGVAWNATSHPRASMPGLSNYTLTGTGITFNFDTLTTSGTLTRLAQNAAFGSAAEVTPGVELLPGRIECEDYRLGGEGDGYHDTTPGNTGGAYRTDDPDIQAASPGGIDVTGPVDFTDASGWTNWKDVTIAGVGLTAGPHELRFVVDTPGFNLDRIQVALPPPPAPAETGGSTSSRGRRCGLLGIEVLLPILAVTVLRRRRVA